MMESVRIAMELASITAVAVCMVVGIVVAVCEIIDFTRRVEDPIGSLTDEEESKTEGGQE